MDNVIKNEEMKENKENKKTSFAEGLTEAGLIFGGITLGMALMASLMGGTAEVVSNLSMNHTAQTIFASEDYQLAIRDEQYRLVDELTSGKISIDEYNEAVNNLRTIESVIEYSKTASDEELAAIVKSYEESQKMADTMFKKGVPTFAAGTAIGAGITGVGVLAGKSKKKKEESPKELSAE